VISAQSQTVARPPSGAVLAATKLQVPGAREGLVPRERLVAALTAAAPRKLTLVNAPAGSGKTTLLSEWHAASAEERPFAWLSLDHSDNDPVRFYEGVIAAFRTVAPGIGDTALTALTGPANLTDVALPSLINELAALPDRIVLVLDDYHLITNQRVHASVDFLLEHLPDTLHLAIATRSEPPLALSRLRVRRELVEVGTTDLRFTDDEAASLLNGVLGPSLEREDIAQLQGRTEGWAAGLQLAALSLLGREDAHGFISSFAGDDRPIVDYLGFEVLDGQDPETRSFLLRTSVLARLSGPLCDAVLGEEGSAAKLAELERANLFVIPLDDKREWYRYHHLFSGLLRHELARTEAGLVPELHGRASAWFRDHGSVSEAIRHATAAGDTREASELITLHWYDYVQRGRIETVAGWLEALGDEAVAGDAGLCLTKAWMGVNTGSLGEVARWIDAADRARLADTSPRVESGIAALREIHRYMGGDVDEAVEAGRRSTEHGDTPWRPVGCPVLGIALFWSGRPEEAADELEQSVDTARSAGNHLAVIHASGGLAAIRAEQGDVGGAGELADDALELAEECSLEEHWATTLARVVRGRALEREGKLSEAEAVIERSVELSRRGVAAVEIAYALLSQAEARQLHGDSDGARKVLREARRVIDSCPDPGILEDMLARTERRLQRAPYKRSEIGAPDELTDRELAVLRLLPGRLSQREVADALYVSVNTVKTHTKSIYRKLGVDARDDAVQRARELGVL
jgi:LuxR family transcriptional regulator, maltose regulon positive regulatory protein